MPNISSLTTIIPTSGVEQGCDCPKEETTTVVRAVRAGGVRAINGGELRDHDLAVMHVTLVQGSDTIRVNPFKLADSQDNDNNIDLCRKETGIPILIEVDAGVAIDPRDDANPHTKMKVVSRW